MRILLIFIMAILLSGCSNSDNVESTTGTPESTPEETGTDIPTVTGTVFKTPSDATPVEQSPEETKKPPDWSSPVRDIVIKDSKAVLGNTTDNVFVIGHDGGDRISVENIEIIVYRENIQIDHMFFDPVVDYYRGKQENLKSSPISYHEFEKGKEIVVGEKPDFNFEPGDNIRVKVVDAKWNVTVIDTQVEVY